MPISKSMKRVGIALGVLVAAVAAWHFGLRAAFAPTPTAVTPGVSIKTNTPPSPDAPAPQPPKTVADGLRIPWAIAKLGDTLLVTERPGSIRQINPDGTTKTYPIAGVSVGGEGGLMGIAPYQTDAGSFVYLCHTAKKAGAITIRVVRYRWTDKGPVEDKVILDDISGGIYHDGCTVAFGPDGMLYATAGEGGTSTRAQDTKSLSGKILRVTPDGGIPADNPFGNAVWSYGHRNPQGITWDDKGRLWATEHGRSGATSGMDELNLIVKGGNYGWPTIEGNKAGEGMITPITNSGPNETWAPSGIAWLNGKLYFAGLRGESLYEATPSADGKSVTLRAHFHKDFGRLRAVKVIDGKLYVTTSNTDGRGTPKPGDDRLLEIDPRIFDGK